MPTKHFLYNIDLNKNQILNGVLQNLAADPTDPIEGQIYHNTVSKAPRIYTNSAWLDIGGNIKGFKNTSIVTVTVAAGLATIAIEKATITVDGLMSKEDKVILNGLNADDTLSQHIIDSNNPHSVNKTDIALGNADNTSDANKPISTATQTALNGKSDSGHGHGDLHVHANAVELAKVTDGDHDVNKANPHVVTKSQVGLGSADNTSDANKPISTATQTALNLKSNTDHGHGDIHAHANAVELAKVTDGDHDVNKANPHVVTKSQVGLGSVDNTSDANKPISTATQTALNHKANITDVAALIDPTLKTPEAFNASVNSYPVTYTGQSIQKGDTFRITVAGTMGTKLVGAEDLLIALLDAPGQTDANWMVAESNRDQATESVKGVAEIATQIEVDAGADDTRFITPLKLKNRLGGDLPIGRKFEGSIAGNGVLTQWTFTHNFDTINVVVQAVDGTGKSVELYWEADAGVDAPNKTIFLFNVAPTESDIYNITIIG